MKNLLYFAFWAGLIFLMMRLGCGSHVMGHGHDAEEHEGHDGDTSNEGGSVRCTPPETDIDPVCRMSVRTDTAKCSVFQGVVYYFCSAEHRDAFEADPERYLGQRAPAKPTPMEHDHE
ncbi:YHS domain-containing protein (plasmid) [Burkholderia thailandensis]|uniref:YHS domain-containing protein n=1 Tax=Burkholderia thailandensis TaxID=57975 RepID=UPI00192D87DF|nr:YHS domain-containing protein [Burkholderia thailandensis]MBS2132168.1 YHS domain-containing protein [Burkholderia thailandensis]QRA15271.1 YHS domain-containing protein [Burkholderia thailandensis]